MRTKKQKLAIFDIDGTLIRSSLLIEAFNGLVDAGIFPKKAAREVEENHTAWLDRVGHYDDYMMNVVRVYYRHLRGKRVSQVRAALDKIILGHRNRTYRYTRNLLASLRKKNYCLVALSNSQDCTVETFAKANGFDLAIGLPIEVSNGKYTGFSIINGKRFPTDMKLNKPKLLEDFLAERDIVADLKRSIAIGDSEGDRAILSAVGTAIAFNPSYELARLAQRKHWKIVIERKDVMYHIDKARIEVAERPQEKAKISNT